MDDMTPEEIVALWERIEVLEKRLEKIEQRLDASGCREPLIKPRDLIGNNG